MGIATVDMNCTGTVLCMSSICQESSHKCVHLQAQRVSLAQSTIKKCNQNSAIKNAIQNPIQRCNLKM